MTTPSHETITGPLTKIEVPRWYQHWLQGKQAALPQQIDLSGVEAVDSSALALLLALKHRQPKLELMDPPKTLTTLARLSGVSELLSWPSESESTASRPSPEPIEQRGD